MATRADTLAAPAARAAAAPTDKPVDNVVGSGPFMFKRDEWSPGAKVVFVRNPAYVARTEPASGFAGSKRAYFDRVEWQIINDHQTALDALKAGNLNLNRTTASLSRDADIVKERL